eukprot:403372621
MTDLYEVEKIVTFRKQEGSTVVELFIKWENYPDSDNTWQILDEFYPSVPEMVNEFFALEGYEMIECVRQRKKCLTVRKIEALKTPAKQSLHHTEDNDENVSQKSGKNNKGRAAAAINNKKQQKSRANSQKSSKQPTPNVKNTRRQVNIQQQQADNHITSNQHTMVQTKLSTSFEPIVPQQISVVQLPDPQIRSSKRDKGYESTGSKRSSKSSKSSKSNKSKRGNPTSKFDKYHEIYETQKNKNNQDTIKKFMGVPSNLKSKPAKLNQQQIQMFLEQENQIQMNQQQQIQSPQFMQPKPKPEILQQLLPQQSIELKNFVDDQNEQSSIGDDIIPIKGYNEAPKIKIIHNILEEEAKVQRNQKKLDNIEGPSNQTQKKSILDRNPTFNKNQQQQRANDFLKDNKDSGKRSPQKKDVDSRYQKKEQDNKTPHQDYRKYEEDDYKRKQQTLNRGKSLPSKKRDYHEYQKDQRLQGGQERQNKDEFRNRDQRNHSPQKGGNEASGYYQPSKQQTVTQGSPQNGQISNYQNDKIPSSSKEIMRNEVPVQHAIQKPQLPPVQQEYTRALQIQTYALFENPKLGKRKTRDQEVSVDAEKDLELESKRRANDDQEKAMKASTKCDFDFLVPGYDSLMKNLDARIAEGWASRYGDILNDSDIPSEIIATACNMEYTYYLVAWKEKQEETLVLQPCWVLNHIVRLTNSELVDEYVDRMLRAQIK